MKNKFNKGSNIVGLLIFSAVAIFIFVNAFSVFQATNMYFRFDLIEIFFWIVFLVIFASIISAFVKTMKNSKKSGIKSISEDNLTSDSNSETDASFDDSLDAEFDALSQHLKDSNRSYDGIIRNKYSSFDKKGNLIFILVVKDLAKFDEFETIVDNDFFNNHYIGQKVLIIRGLKRKIKDID